MANNRKLDPVPLSTLPEIEDASGFWIFGSKDRKDGSVESVKYPFEKLAEYAQRLQLERRISLRMESSTTDLFIGEKMTIYKVLAYNVGALKLIIGDEEIPVEIDEDIEVGIEAGSIIAFNVETLLTDPTAYLYVYAKVKTT